MRHARKILLVLIGLLFAAGCDSRLDKTDGGGVLLSVDFEELPNIVHVSAARSDNLVLIPSITIQSIVRDIDGDISDLMNVEMQSYEVTFTRADGGTRVPSPLVELIFGVVPPGNTIVYNNLPIMRSGQIDNPPVSDLFIENGGFDKETRRTSILFNVSVRFFGRSIGGEAVDTAPVRFTVEFVP